MENQESKSKYFWGMILPLIITILIQNALSIFIMEIVFVYDMGHYTNGSYVDFVNSWIDQVSSSAATGTIYLVYSISCIIIFYFMYKKFKGKEIIKKDMFVGISDNAPMCLIGLVVFSFGLQYVSIYLMNSVATMFPSWMETYEELIESSGLLDDNNVVMVIYAVFLAPICEELAFRGLALSNARKIMPAPAAIVAQALLFAIFHGNMIQGCYTFIIGLAFGYLAYRYDNLIIPIALHMIYNAIGTFLSDYLPVGGADIVEFFFWFLGSLIVAYFGLWLLQKAAPGVKVSDDSSDM